MEEKKVRVSLVRWNHECVEISDKKKAHENLFRIFRDTIDKIKELEEEEEDPA